MILRQKLNFFTKILHYDSFRTTEVWRLHMQYTVRSWTYWPPYYGVLKLLHCFCAYCSMLLSTRNKMLVSFLNQESKEHYDIGNNINIACWSECIYSWGNEQLHFYLYGTPSAHSLSDLAWLLSFLSSFQPIHSSLFSSHQHSFCSSLPVTSFLSSNLFLSISSFLLFLHPRWLRAGFTVCS